MNVARIVDRTTINSPAGATQLTIRKSISRGLQPAIYERVNNAILYVAEDHYGAIHIAHEGLILRQIHRFGSLRRMLVLQNDLENSACQVRPKPLRRHELLVYETDLDRAPANTKAQDAVSAFADRCPQDLQYFGAMGLERLYALPRGRLGISE
jgi:hypothetical protein